MYRLSILYGEAFPPILSNACVSRAVRLVIRAILFLSVILFITRWAQFSISKKALSLPYFQQLAA
ncbi:hypothetical protein CW304_26280 [Bacillus sp. UFRGS-B20]|nr:hypothetical protein CW304_26280 [Bacillus sp. UFRGS-B20]